MFSDTFGQGQEGCGRRQGHHHGHHTHHGQPFGRRARMMAHFISRIKEAGEAISEAVESSEAESPGGMRFGHRGGFFGGWGGHGHGFPPIPPGFPFGPGRRGQRVKRGDVRAAILALLGEQPRNGYQLIQEIAERSGGVWKPSPGAVYPALQQLEDEDLIRGEEREGKRVFALTEAGRTYLAERPEEAAPPWANLGEAVPDQIAELQGLLGQVMGAGMQLAQAANEQQLEKAKQLLSQTRRSLYAILAEEED